MLLAGCIGLAVLPVLPASPAASSPDQPLKDRWAKTTGSLRTSRYPGGVWIGYSIQRLMRENSHIGSCRSDWENKPSLREIITGQRFIDVEAGLSDSEVIRRTAHKIIETGKTREKPVKKVMKDVAILFLFKPGTGRDLIMDKLEISDLSLHFDLEELDLLWMGKAENRESISLLEQLYGKERSPEVRDDLVTAVSLHQEPEPVIRFLSGVINSREDDEIRENAVFWAGQQNHARALELLKKVAGSDRSTAVREKAVFSISQMRSDESVQVLMDLAERGDPEEVREKAVFWLGQKDDPKLLKVLMRYAENDPSMKIRENAVFAINQMKSLEALEALIQLACHAKAKPVRKKAVFWLGQKASRRAAESLEKLAYSDKDTEIQVSAIFALSQLSNEESVPRLIDIARSHPSLRVRKRAIFWLGQSDDPRAVDALVSMVRKSSE
jgi:HEAT repeat protein